MLDFNKLEQYVKIFRIIIKRIKKLFIINMLKEGKQNSSDKNND